MIETEADAPAYRPDVLPVTSTVTGKVATPELVLAVSPIEATVPLTGPDAPSAVITTWSPSLILSTTLASTFASITSLLLTTVITSLDPLEALPPEPPDPPDPPDPDPPPSSPDPSVPPDPPEPPEPPESPPEPLTCSPTV